MLITVSKQDLEAALQVASIGIASSGSDLSTHFVFRIVDGKVEVLSYNDRICTTTPINCQHEGDDGDALTIEGWRLLKWLGGVGDVALSFESSPGEVRATSPRSTIKLRSLDPSKYPFFDKTLGEAKFITKLGADRLASALGYTRRFISDKETTRPEISQVEAAKGCLWATDTKAVSLVSVSGLDDSNLRIHNKDAPSVLKFLSLKGTDEVEILEHDRTAFLRRADGATLGVVRPLAAFPKLNVDKDAQDDSEWEVKTDDLLAAIQCLSASAEKENTKVRFAYRAADGKVVMSVESAAGGSDEYALECLSERNAKDVPDGGFELDHPYINGIVGHFGGDSLKFGITKAGKGGFIRFLHSSEDKDTFVTVVVWRSN